MNEPPWSGRVPARGAPLSSGTRGPEPRGACGIDRYHSARAAGIRDCPGAGPGSAGRPRQGIRYQGARLREQGRTRLRAEGAAHRGGDPPRRAAAAGRLVACAAALPGVRAPPAARRGPGRAPGPGAWCLRPRGATRERVGRGTASSRRPEPAARGFPGRGRAARPGPRRATQRARVHRGGIPCSPRAGRAVGRGTPRPHRYPESRA